MSRYSQCLAQVNGSRRNLPVAIESKIKVQISGGYVLLETDFGLGVRFDGNHHAEVSVPCDYKDQLCGLCGEYLCSLVPQSHSISSCSIHCGIGGLFISVCTMLCLSQSNPVRLVWTGI